MYRVNFLFIALLPILAIAMPNDSKQRLHVVSSTSTYNYKAGTTIFEGNVIATQGTSHITADKLVTKSKGTRSIEEAIAYGLLRPAHYWTTPGNNKPIINAYAGVIKYFPTSGKITMQRDAYVTQGKNIFKGPIVLYNMNSQVIHVPSSHKGRSILIYNPDES